MQNEEGTVYYKLWILRWHLTSTKVGMGITKPEGACARSTDGPGGCFPAPLGQSGLLCQVINRVDHPWAQNNRGSSSLTPCQVVSCFASSQEDSSWPTLPAKGSGPPTIDF